MVPLDRPDHDRVAKRDTGLAQAVEVGHHDDAVLNRDAEQRDEADRRRHIEGLA
jgi:hypothetical protein